MLEPLICLCFNQPVEPTTPTPKPEDLSSSQPVPAVRTKEQIAQAKRTTKGAFGGGSKKVVNIYLCELIEYSPAEGGCYWERMECVRSIPARKLGRNEAEQIANAGKVASEMGLTPEGTLIPSEGYAEGYRFARGIRSSRPEVDCRIYVESKPKESEDTTFPHYE